MEAQFPLGLALAALALDNNAHVPAFDADHERPMSNGASHAVVTTVGYLRGEGLAVLSANG
jgi:3-oxoacyl-[acyl-carrier-protein] synthase II